MNRATLVFCLAFCFGCSDQSDPDTGKGEPDQNAVEDGGTVESADRDQAKAYFAALRQVQSAEEETTLLTEFGDWLRTKGYRITVEVKGDGHILSCPHFPPVTPWTDHSFLDLKNLELLPRTDDGE